MKRAILVFLILAACLPSLSHATAIAISDMRFLWSTLNIRTIGDLSIEWQNDPFDFGQDLVAFDYLSGTESLWAETHSPDFAFTAVGTGTMVVTISFEGSYFGHKDYENEMAFLWTNYEMWLRYADGTPNPYGFSDWCGAGFLWDDVDPGHSVANSFSHSMMPVDMYLNDGDSGILSFWLHREMSVRSVASPVPEPSTIFLSLIGLAALGMLKLSKSRKKLLSPTGPTA